MKVLSPAKLNLMLRVLGQRTDGYHLLQTYFQLLDWGDEMEFLLSKQDSINIKGEFNNLAAKDNLIYKAAQLLLPYRSLNKGIHIKVNKSIPLGSGLGGGSSNAGTTLRILNKLWKCNRTENQLLKLSITLGADVPLFILNQSAMAMGIGEILTPFKVKNYVYVLIFPDTSISTVDVFSDKNLKRNQKAIEFNKINDVKYWNNTCLPIVLKSYPEVADMHTIASQHTPIFMSGTGSTLFSCFKTHAKAQQFMMQCPKHWKMQICQSK